MSILQALAVQLIAEESELLQVENPLPVATLENDLQD
jgi:hypothetical protein